MALTETERATVARQVYEAVSGTHEQRLLAATDALTSVDRGMAPQPAPSAWMVPYAVQTEQPSSPRVGRVRSWLRHWRLYMAACTGVAWPLLVGAAVLAIPSRAWGVTAAGVVLAIAIEYAMVVGRAFTRTEALRIADKVVVFGVGGLMTGALTVGALVAGVLAGLCVLAFVVLAVILKAAGESRYAPGGAAWKLPDDKPVKVKLARDWWTGRLK